MRLTKEAYSAGPPVVPDGARAEPHRLDHLARLAELAGREHLDVDRVGVRVHVVHELVREHGVVDAEVGRSGGMDADQLLRRGLCRGRQGRRSARQDRTACRMRCMFVSVTSPL